MTGTASNSHYERLVGDNGNRWIAASLAAKTKKLYASAVGLFHAWCTKNDHAPLPVAPDVLRLYVEHLADQDHTYETIRGYLTGLSFWHGAHGHKLDRSQITQTMRGIKRTRGATRQARPLLAEDLRDILAMSDPRKPSDARDCAVLAIGFPGALRRGELVGLDWQIPGRKSTGVLRFRPDAGIEIELLKSKNSQGEAVTIEISNGDMPDAAEWLKHWLRHVDLKPGEAVFRRLDRAGKPFNGRLSDDAITDIIRRRVIALEMARGVDRDNAFSRAQAFSGHSLRAGYATSAARAGVHEWRIRERMRHKTPGMVARYVRAAETRAESGLAGLGFRRTGDDPAAAPAPAGHDRPKCGARIPDGRACQAAALPNGRCARHGGLSSGPKTAEGRAKLRKAASDTQKRIWQERRDGKRPMPRRARKAEPEPQSTGSETCPI